MKWYVVQHIASHILCFYEEKKYFYLKQSMTIINWFYKNVSEIGEGQLFFNNLNNVFIIHYVINSDTLWGILRTSTYFV